MVSRDFQALAARRARRARQLAQRYSFSREALEFFAEVASLQSDLAAGLTNNPASVEEILDSLLHGRNSVTALVKSKGPRQLQDEALAYDEQACRQSLRAYLDGDDLRSPRSLFARMLLQPGMYTWDLSGLRLEPPKAPQNRAGNCPRCAHSPQAGVLHPRGDGAALLLACSLCLHEWPFTRLKCPECGESGHQKLGFYGTAEFPDLETQVCESCKTYLHLVHLGKDPEAVAEVDELAALPLDVWARERGYRKIQSNMAGM